MKASEKSRFIKTVKAYYEKHGRHDLPWRKTKDPYKIAVSEVMLQQTQVNRVIEKYKEFLTAFPTATALAAAPLQQLLLVWNGLGYNRRARFLQQMTQAIGIGKFPQSFDELLKLPGVGNYTAGAISAFAYNIPIPIIETNIRTVYLHHFYNDSAEQVSDKELMKLIEDTLDIDNPREWYWALMDYGTHLKASGVKIHRNSTQYKKQSAFKGSVREVRGGILKFLTAKPATAMQLEKALLFEPARIEKALAGLLKEGFIVRKGKTFSI